MISVVNVSEFVGVFEGAYLDYVKIKAGRVVHCPLVDSLLL